MSEKPLFNFPQVLAGEIDYALDCADAITYLQAFPANSVDLVFGSPPYALKGERYDGARKAWPVLEWVDWMLNVTTEAVRVCKGDVLWVVNGPVEDGRYHPAVEGLLWKWYERGLALERPCVWRKNAPPNNRRWYVNTWEYVVCFPGKEPRYWDWESVATPPKYKNGGKFRQRGKDGKRKQGGDYPQNPLTRPRDVVEATVGGGHMGWAGASDTEAPYPQSLVEQFLPAICPKGGVVLDCFGGSFTTAAVAVKHGRRFVGCDVRPSQIELGHRRLQEQALPA